MAEFWEDSPEVEDQAPAQEDWWAKSAPVKGQQEEWWSQSKPVEPEPEAEGPIKTFVRQAAHAALPSIAAIRTGAQIGGAIGTAVGGPIGTALGIVGGGVVGLGAGYLAGQVQETGAKLLGYDDSHQLAINAKTNPNASLLGELAPAAATLSPRGATILARGAGGIAMGGLEAGGEYLRGEEFDPKRILASTATGAIFSGKPTPLGRAIGLPEVQPHGTAGPKAQAPSEPVPPTTDTSATQEPQNQAVRSERQYAKPREMTPEEIEAARTGLRTTPPAVNEIPYSYADPTLEAAIAAKQGAPAGEPPNIFQQMRERLDRERAEQGLPPGRPLEFPERVPPTEPGGAPAPGAEGAARPGPAAAEPAGEPAAARQVELPTAFQQQELPPGMERLADRLRMMRNIQAQDTRAQAAEAERARIARQAPPEPPPETQLQQRGPIPETTARFQERMAAQRAEEGGGAPPGQPPTPPPEGPPRGPAGPEGLASPPDFTPQKPSAWRSFLGAVAPTLRSDYARQKGNEINAAHGEFNQVRDQVMDAVDPRRLDPRKGGGARELFNTLQTTDPGRLRALVNQMQGGTTFAHIQPTAEETAAMSAVKGGFDRWAGELQKNGVLDRFIDEYLPGMYKDQEKARDAIAQFRARGDAGMTLEKAFSNYEQARTVAGLEPKTMNPVEMLDLYSQNAKDLLTAKRLETNYLNTGEFKHMKEPPAGWSQIMTSRRGQTGIYAPDDLARVWNNWIDQGMKARHKDAVEAVQHLTNAWTTFELGINGYHMVTMAHEGVSHDLARAFSQLLAGRPLEAAMTAIKAPAAPILTPMKGAKTIADWLDPNHQSVGMDLLRDADVRFIGRGHAADTMMARKGFLDFLSSEGWKSQFRKAWYDMRGSVAEAPTVLGKGKAIFDNIGRAMQTVSAPIFDVYIPYMKAGAIMKNVEDWLASNSNLDLRRGTADWTHAVDQIRKITNTIDNRFGEMITDHLFLNRTMQQSAQIGMRSFSWTLGSMKEIAGGAASAGRGAVNQILGKDANLLQKLQMGSEHYDPRIAYLMGFPTAIAFAGIVSQFLMTGEKPRDTKDLFLPRTGGQVAGFGGRGRVDERLLLPGYMKDVLAWTHHPMEEAYRKLNGLVTSSYETAKGEDSLGRPFVNPKGSMLDQVADRAHYFLSKMGPISLRNYIQGQKPGSNIPAAMAGVGFRAPGAEYQDPEGYRRGMEAMQQRGYKAREKSIQRQQRQAAPETRGFARGGPVQPRKKFERIYTDGRFRYTPLPPRERFLQRRDSHA